MENRLILISSSNKCNNYIVTTYKYVWVREENVREYEFNNNNQRKCYEFECEWRGHVMCWKEERKGKMN